MARRYRLLVSAEFEISAENAAEARRAAERVRVIGEHSGARRPGRNDRDLVRYSVRRLHADFLLKPKGSDE